MLKLNHSKKKREIVDALVKTFFFSGAEYTSIASFYNAMDDLAETCAMTALQQGYLFSKAQHFRIVATKNMFLSAAAKKYHNEIYMKDIS